MFPDLLFSYAYSYCTNIDHFGTQIFIDGPETIRRGLQYVTRLESHHPRNTDRQVILLEVLTFYADEPVAPGSITRATQPAGNLDDRLVQSSNARPFASTIPHRPSTSNSLLGATFSQSRPSSGTPDSSSTRRDSPGRFGLPEATRSERVPARPGSRTLPSSQSERVYPSSVTANAIVPRDEFCMQPTTPSHGLPGQSSGQSAYQTGNEGAHPNALPQGSGHWSPAPIPNMVDRYSSTGDASESSASGHRKGGYGYRDGSGEDRHRLGPLRVDQLKPLDEPSDVSHAYPLPTRQRYDSGSGITASSLQQYASPAMPQQQQSGTPSSRNYTQRQMTTLPPSRFTSHMHIPPFQGSSSGLAAGARSADGTEV